MIAGLQVLNHDLLFSVPYCLFLNSLLKETTCKVMVDHLESRGTPWRHCASHVKVRGTLSKMDVRAHVEEKLLVAISDCDSILDTMTRSTKLGNNMTCMREKRCFMSSLIFGTSVRESSWVTSPASLKFITSKIIDKMQSFSFLFLVVKQVV